MKLSPKDRDLFFQLFIPLLDFTNYVFKVGPRFDDMWKSGGPDIQYLSILADTLWTNSYIIDEYVELAEDLSKEDKEIILSWKRFVRGEFIIYKQLMSGSIFMSNNEAEVYQVLGITESISETPYLPPLPVPVIATLLPFKGRIITDGLFTPYQIPIKKKVRDILEQTYTLAKDQGKIITKL